MSMGVNSANSTTVWIVQNVNGVDTCQSCCSITTTEYVVLVQVPTDTDTTEHGLACRILRKTFNGTD